MARLYLLCGLPFSGKSTLARQLARRLSGTVVSFDAINYERGLGFAGEREVSPAEWDETYGLARSRVAALLRTGRDVILDDVMGFAQARRDFRELASASGGRRWWCTSMFRCRNCGDGGERISCCGSGRTCSQRFSSGLPRCSSRRRLRRRRWCSGRLIGSRPGLRRWSGPGVKGAMCSGWPQLVLGTP